MRKREIDKIHNLLVEFDDAALAIVEATEAYRDHRDVDGDKHMNSALELATDALLELTQYMLKRPNGGLAEVKRAKKRKA